MWVHRAVIVEVDRLEKSRAGDFMCSNTSPIIRRIRLHGPGRSIDRPPPWWISTMHHIVWLTDPSESYIPCCCKFPHPGACNFYYENGNHAPVPYTSPPLVGLTPQYVTYPLYRPASMWGYPTTICPVLWCNHTPPPVDMLWWYHPIHDHLPPWNPKHLLLQYGPPPCTCLPPSWVCLAWYRLVLGHV